MAFMNKKLKTTTTAFTLFAQGILSMIIGITMLLNYTLFFTRVSTLIYAYFIFIIFSTFIQIIVSCTKSFEGLSQAVLSLFASALALSIFHFNIHNIFEIIPLAMTAWSLLLTISSLISFFQYRTEKTTAPLRYLLSSLIHFGFAIPFMFYANNSIALGTKLIGLYMIFLSFLFLIDGLAQIVTNKYVNSIKNRIRITPPVFLATFFPVRTLNSLNEFFKETFDDESPFITSKSDKQANVEIFIHASKSLKGTAGHVDLLIDDAIICYGTYDKDDLKFGGIIGAGVFYEVYNKKEYLAFCKDVRQETIFEFGLLLSEDELNGIRRKISDLKGRSNIWKCKAQRAKERGEDVSMYQELPCLLSQATETVFYKLYSGSYKYYWILETNCAKFTDDLLKASGMRTILNGVITPGTYFSYLNDEFAKNSHVVVSRTIHHV
ncbi:MAG: hypothetical protein R3Y47_00680 [Lachnospiraceae bacterium]